MNWKFNRQYRLPYYNYAIEGLYFITICTHQRVPYFGSIQNGIFIPTCIGLFIQNNINQLKDIGTTQPESSVGSGIDKVSIDHYIVMPDHIHFILEVPVQESSAQLINPGLRPLIKGSVEAWVNHFKGFTTKWCFKRF